MRKSRFKSKTKQTIPTTRVSVIVISDDRILLVRHRKGNRQYWVLPGGRLEYGETFKECAIREMKEETGFDVVVERFVYLSEAIAPDRSRHIVNIFLKARVTGGAMKLGNEPVLAGVEFVALSELEKVSLFPPVARQILQGFAPEDKGMAYLGNLWV